VPRNRTVRSAVLGVSVRRPAAGNSTSRSTAALKRRLVVGCLALLSLVLVTLSFGRDRGPLSGAQDTGAAILRPFQIATDRVAEPFRDAWAWFDGLFDARSDADRLAEENEQLRQELVRSEIAVSENARLRALLKYRSAPAFPDGYAGRAAAVIARPAGPYAQSIVVAVGRKDGVEVGDPVVTQDGLVGRVIRVADRSARVVLLTDEQSAVSALDASTDGQGIVRRGQGPRSALRLDRVPKEQVVRAGDTIVTAGWRTARLSSLYPRGIPIGKVTSVGQTDTYPYKQVLLEPFVDFTSLDAVLVLVPELREGEQP
jgi:rod shape-determining protein MreC